MNALLAAINLLVFRTSIAQEIEVTQKIQPAHPHAIGGVYAPIRPLQPVTWN